MKTSGAKRIAERYVKALFDVAQSYPLKDSASAIVAVEKNLAALAASLDENEDFRHFLTNPLLSRQAQADVMKSILTKMKAHKVTQQFMATLARHRRLPVLPEIIAQFIAAAQESRGEMNAELIAASKLAAKQIDIIGESLSKTYGKKVNLGLRQDSNLLGGVVIKIGSVQLDGSLAGKLTRLGLALKVA